MAGTGTDTSTGTGTGTETGTTPMTGTGGGLGVVPKLGKRAVPYAVMGWGLMGGCLAHENQELWGGVWIGCRL